MLNNDLICEFCGKLSNTIPYVVKVIECKSI